MNMDENCNKRRRLNSKEVPSSSCSITDLPDVLLQACLSFVGPGHYRFVAGTCHQFQENYNFPERTTWGSAAMSVSCAKLCLHDNALTESMSKYAVIDELEWTAVSKGQISVLQWALKDHAYVCDNVLFARAGKNGHVNVLEWGENNGMHWFSTDLCNAAARNGHVGILDWIHQRVPVECDQSVAAGGGHIPVLRWLKEHGLLELDSIGMWFVAATEGHIHILEWLLENEFINRDVAVEGATITGRIDVLVWARDRGVALKTTYCVYAAANGHLPTLQWLRENGCPWNSRTIVSARLNNHLEIEQWARDNGCPEPGEDFDDELL